MASKIYQEGQRVRLKANKREGWDEEFGEIVGDYDPKSDTYLVQVEGRISETDDGLREVTADQVEEVPHGLHR